MKKAGYILSLIILFLAMESCTTSKNAIPQKPFECSLLNYPVKDFKTDLFGNIYIIDLKNRLKVYDKDLNLLFEYYNNILGEISYVDVTNPKKIAIFFNGFQKIIFVDDTLSELGRYEGDYNIIAMGTSRDNNVWIYDGLDYRLKKITADNRILIESNPLESYHQLDILPDYIIEHNNMVYVIEETKGLAVFDNFGTFSNYIPLKASSIAFNKDQMIYANQGKILQKSVSNVFDEERLIKTVPTSTVETAYISEKSILYLDERCLMKLPLD